MAEEDDAQKTEEPTPKKLQKSRSKGEVAQSQEVKSLFVLLAGAGAMMFMAPYVATSILEASLPFVAQAHDFSFDRLAMRQTFVDVTIVTAWAIAPAVLLIFLFAFASNVMQFGFLLAPEKIKPDFSKISLIKGVKRMFSLRTFVEFLKGIGKLVIVAVVSVALTIPMLYDVEVLPAFSVGALLERTQDILIVLIIASAGVMLVIAALDWSYQTFEFTKKMRMTKQEVKDEHKQSEGDPQVKAKIRALRQARAKERMMAAVPNADVVITNPTHFAVALQYDPQDMAAPILVAKGVDDVAFRIREVAEEAEVPIVENPPLARALFASVELDEQIPAEHFIAVAEVIGYVMRLKGKTLH